MIRNLLRFLGWVCLLVLVATGVVALVYFLSERPQKVAIEQRMLDAVDVVREDRAPPLTLADATEATRIGIAVTESLRTGKLVEL